jgi:APA family basic amino acid/polyamine antiporter
MASTTEDVKTGLVKGLGLLDSTALVVGTMIGSGIFIVSSDIARQVGSAGLLLVVWLVSAAITMTAALSYGELAAAMPHAGGQYVYLREEFGPLSGFLYGWTLFLVIQTGTIAAVAVAFAKYLGVFIPWIAAGHYLPGTQFIRLDTQRIVAIALLVSLTWLNTRGVRTGAAAQNLFTAAKLSGVLGLAAVGLFLAANPQAVSRNFASWHAFWGNASLGWTSIRLVGVALVGALFSSDAWNNITFTAGEVKNPRRNVPLSLVLGVGIVTTLYLALNVVYLRALPLEAIQSAPEDRVATAAASVLLGAIAVKLVALTIVLSTCGCVNGLVLMGARVYYAMALDGLFFERAGRLDPVRHTPTASLIMQCAWACLLTLSGRYSDLLDYVIFAVMLFYILTIAGLFRLRRTQPNLDRPYRAFGYPVLPALYVAAGTLVEILLLIYKPNFTWPGLIIVLLGIPVYFLRPRRATSAPRN